MSRCDDKSVTRKILGRANLRVPDQITADSASDVEVFVKEHRRVLVNPLRAEQVKTIDELDIYPWSVWR
jgi:hypothetical protein